MVEVIGKAGERMSFKAAKSMVTRERPPVPRTIEALGIMLESDLPSRHFYQAAVSAPGPPDSPERVHAIIFARQNMLERLLFATKIHVDGTFKVKLHLNHILEKRFLILVVLVVLILFWTTLNYLRQRHIVLGGCSFIQS